MTRMILVLNFCGVLALAVLCCLQWNMNRQLNLKAIALEKIRLEQIAQLAEQDLKIRGYIADLDEFRGRLTLAESQLKELETKLNVMTAARNELAMQNSQLIAQRDQLKLNLDKWVAAVAERDAVIKQASEQIQKLTMDRNEAVVKFNDLAGKYNALVKDWNSGKTGKTGSATQPADKH